VADSKLTDSWHSLENGALESLDQLGDRREDRAVGGGELRVSGVYQPALDGLSSIGCVTYRS